MKELSPEESKSILVEILESIDSCCRNNHISYSLAYGTLLGAVRHHGFIPWDDDIDLMMKRDQLDLFIKCYDDSRYDLISNDDPEWGWHYVRIADKRTILEFQNSYERVRPHGLWVAIFPVDNAPDGEGEWQKMKKEIQFYTNLGRFKRSRWAPTGFVRNILKALMRILLVPVSRVKLAKLEEKKMKTYNNTVTSRCFNRVIKYQLMPSYFFDSIIDLDFEGKKYMGISCYDEYLRNEYGNYMQFPPVSDRVPRHDYKVYSVE